VPFLIPTDSAVPPAAPTGAEADDSHTIGKTGAGEPPRSNGIGASAYLPRFISAWTASTTFCMAAFGSASSPLR